MDPKVYKIIDVVGCSTTSFQNAVENAVAEAGKTLKGLAWFEVKEHRGGLKDGKVSEYQAVVRIGFRIID
jgi:flavin-binding protein dodecin